MVSGTARGSFASALAVGMALALGCSLPGLYIAVSLRKRTCAANPSPRTPKCSFCGSFLSQLSTELGLTVVELSTLDISALSAPSWTMSCCTSCRMGANVPPSVFLIVSEIVRRMCFSTFLTDEWELGEANTSAWRCSTMRTVPLGPPLHSKCSGKASRYAPSRLCTMLQEEGNAAFAALTQAKMVSGMVPEKPDSRALRVCC